jgi:hypothetical protein
MLGPARDSCQKGCLREYPELGFSFQRSIKRDNIGGFGRDGLFLDQIIGEITFCRAISQYCA